MGGRLPGTARRRRAGCAAEAAPSRRARRGAERTAPREGPARARSEWTGANRAGRAGSRDPGAGTARLLRSQDRPEGGGRLKSEPRAQLRAGRAGGVLIRATSGCGYPEPPGAPLPWRREPPPQGYSSAPGASPSAAAGPRADRRRRAEEPDTGWGGRPRGLFVPGRGSGCTARCLGPFATVSSAPSPAPLGPHLPQSLRPGWVLGLGLCVGGRGALSGKPREPRGRLLAALVSAVDPESPAYLSPPIRAPVGAGSRPPSMLHCPFRTPGGGAGVRGHALSLPPPLAWSRMQKANEC